MNALRALVIAVCSALCVSTHAMADDVYRQASARELRAVGKSFLGVHIMYLVPRADVHGGRPTPWPEIPVGGIRLWDSGVRWADVEPQRGRWQFDRLDAYVQIAAQHGADVDYVLGSPPAWASARPSEKCPYGLGCAAEPADTAVWETYVRTIAKRYKGRIAVYELGNEPKFYESPDRFPGNGFYSGSVEKMVEMARIARKVVREEDPQARIASPGFDGGAKWIEMFLAAGGKSLIDIVAYHFYAPDAPGFANQVSNVREVMARQGVSALPLWNTESGFEAAEAGVNSLPGHRKLGRDEQAAAIVQTMVISAAAGIERFYLYAWDHPSMGVIDADDHKQPAYAAVARAATWLSGAKFSGCHQGAADVVSCDGTKDGGPFTIAWSVSGREARVDAPSGMQAGTREAAADTAAPGTATAPTTGDSRVSQQPTLLRWARAPAQ